MANTLSPFEAVWVPTKIMIDKRWQVRLVLCPVCVFGAAGRTGGTQREPATLQPIVQPGGARTPERGGASTAEPYSHARHASPRWLPIHPHARPGESSYDATARLGDWRDYRDAPARGAQNFMIWYEIEWAKPFDWNSPRGFVWAVGPCLAIVLVLALIGDIWLIYQNWQIEKRVAASVAAPAAKHQQGHCVGEAGALPAPSRSARGRVPPAATRNAHVRRGQR